MLLEWATISASSAASAAGLCLHPSALDVGDGTLSVGGGAGSSLQPASAAAGGCEGLAVGVGVAGSSHLHGVA